MANHNHQFAYKSTESCTPLQAANDGVSKAMCVCTHTYYFDSAGLTTLKAESQNVIDAMNVIDTKTTINDAQVIVDEVKVVE